MLFKSTDMVTQVWQHVKSGLRLRQEIVARSWTRYWQRVRSLLYNGFGETYNRKDPAIWRGSARAKAP